MGKSGRERTIMCIRWHCYLVCTNCNNQFIDRDKGWDCAEEAKTVRAVAKTHGWRYVKVANGSFWDFCPRCYARHIEPDE